MNYNDKYNRILLNLSTIIRKLCSYMEVKKSEEYVQAVIRCINNFLEDSFERIVLSYSSDLTHKEVNEILRHFFLTTEWRE